MSEDAASSSSSALSRGHSDSPAWSSTQSIDQGTRRSVVRTTEKSVVFRVRTHEKLSSNREGRSSTRTLHLTQSTDTSGTDDSDVHEVLAELYAEAERKKQRLNSEEETFRRGQERLNSLQREHAELLRNLEQCEQQRKDRIRIQKMLRGPEDESEDYASDSGSDSDYNSYHRRSSTSSNSYHRRGSSSSGNHHHHRRRDGAKKERKRLRRFQSDVSLRFQLLKSECRHSDLQVKNLMEDLRREYSDSCLFGNSLNF